jgi:hypothetical protein
MRKFIVTFLPASLLLAFLAFILATCGGGGGGGGSSTPAATLTGLSVDGPSSVREYGTGTYTATASWSDNSTTAVTPTWSVNSQAATISTSGVLSCLPIDNDQAVTVTATYASGGVTETATRNVALTNIATIPFTAQMLSGKVFFDENIIPGGGYDSSLSILNADFSFEQYSNESPPYMSDYVTGTWSIDAPGNLIVNISGQGTVTVMLISDSATEMQVLIDDGTATPSTATLEKTVPVDNSILAGNYTDDNGDTWIFNPNGTGSTTGAGGFTFTWSVDSGILKVVFNSGYHGWMYARASSQSDATSYTILRWAFVEITPQGGFYDFYGGMELTRR